MLGHIILRDIPKDNAQLDLSIYEIKGGFRGFAQVPAGLHYVSVKEGDGMHEGFWCYLPPSGVIVRILDHETNEFQPCSPADEEMYTTMARSGAMNHALIPVMQRDLEFTTLWMKLVSFIDEETYPVILNSETPMMPPGGASPDEVEHFCVNKFKSRFEQAYLDTHGGDTRSFLAEFQFAFVKFLIEKDEEAGERWWNLLLATFNVGQRTIEEHPDLFPALVEIIILQLQWLPEGHLSGGNELVSQAGNLVEDLMDTGVSNLLACGEKLSAFLEAR